MSANIDSLLRNFLVKQVGTSITRQEAQKLGVENEVNDALNELDTNEIELDLDDALENSEFKAAVTNLYYEQQENNVDEEKDKEEQAKVKEKGSKSGV